MPKDEDAPSYPDAAFARVHGKTGEQKGGAAASLGSQPFTDDDYRAIAAFRAGLRRFIRFSEDAARAAGLSPQQHQLLVAIRGHPGSEPPTIGDLARALQIKHHSAVGLVDRMEQGGYVQRKGSTIDNRRVHVVIAPAGEAVLRSLTAAHRQEHQHLHELLQRLTAELEANLPHEMAVSSDTAVDPSAR
jgi:DNA-binding MarR family transcriptional regulator